MDQKRNADAKARAWVYPGHTDPHDATETQEPRENRKVGAWLEPGHTNLRDAPEPRVIIKAKMGAQL